MYSKQFKNLILIQVTFCQLLNFKKIKFIFQKTIKAHDADEKTKMKDESKNNDETNKRLRSARLSPDDLKDGLRILVLQVKIVLFADSDKKK